MKLISTSLTQASFQVEKNYAPPLAEEYLAPIQTSMKKIFAKLLELFQLFSQKKNLIVDT